MPVGLIIYFDGPDGAGKSTQLELAAQVLKAGGHVVHQTRSLGGTPMGEMLRQAALSANSRPVETDLYIAMACQYALAADIMPRRERGEIVLVDRSPLSILAYQVVAGGLDQTKGFEAVGELMSYVEPDLTIVYQVAAAELKTRRQQRNHPANLDYFEAKADNYHQLVTAGYEEADKFGARLIEANGPVEAVHQATMELIQGQLEPQAH
jgi:dTMP kinase